MSKVTPFPQGKSAPLAQLMDKLLRPFGTTAKWQDLIDLTEKLDEEGEVRSEEDYARNEKLVARFQELMTPERQAELKSDSEALKAAQQSADEKQVRVLMEHMIAGLWKRPDVVPMDSLVWTIVNTDLRDKFDCKMNWPVKRPGASAIAAAVADIWRDEGFKISTPAIIDRIKQFDQEIEEISSSLYDIDLWWNDGDWSEFTGINKAAIRLIRARGRDLSLDDLTLVAALSSEYLDESKVRKDLTEIVRQQRIEFGKEAIENGLKLTWIYIDPARNDGIDLFQGMRDLGYPSPVCDHPDFPGDDSRRGALVPRKACFDLWKSLLPGKPNDGAAT
jgi:hypothetical protein